MISERCGFSLSLVLEIERCNKTMVGEGVGEVESRRGGDGRVDIRIHLLHKNAYD